MSAVPAEPTTIELDADRQFDFWLGEWDCSWVDGGRRCVCRRRELRGRRDGAAPDC